MRPVQLPFIGGSYKSRSLPFSAQTTKNFYIEQRGDGRMAAVYHPWPGEKPFSANSGAEDRGVGVHQGVVYKVTDTTLYSVSSVGTQTPLGTIDGENQCVMVSDGNRLVITTGGKAYAYNGTLTEITDSELETPNSVAFLNSRVIYDGNSGRFVAAELTDPTNINGLNYGTAETAPDDTIRVFVHNQNLYLFGTETTEPWWNSGVGNPPFDRIQGGVMSYGLAAVHAVAANGDFLYFLDHSRVPRRLSGVTCESITNQALSYELQTYATVADCKAFCVEFHGERFFIMTFPSADKTWVYQESAQEWGQLSSGVNDGRHHINSYVYCYGKHLIASGGNIYEWDFNTFTDNGDTIQRERTTAVFANELLGVPGKWCSMGKLTLHCEPGIGLVSGQGSDPQVMMRYSDDGGKTWSSERWASAGQLGQYSVDVSWIGLGRFKSRIFHFRMTDPIKWTLIGLTAEVEAGI